MPPERVTSSAEHSDTAVALLESRYGYEKVLQLLREFQRRSDEDIDQDRLVDETFRLVLGVGWSDFETEWRRFVVS